MPFTYRDKPKLADRLRGKSGEEILNELKSDIDPERRMFFDSPWRTRHNNSSALPRGFPFNDNRNRANIRSYLDEIAARHPEFADQLKEPPWSEDFVNSPFGRKRRGSNSGREENTRNEASGSNPPPTEVKEPRQSLKNFGLRNTVPLGPGAVAEEERRQRSMSAPPDNRAGDKPRRFVTKCEIPVMHDPTEDLAQGKPDPSGKGPQEHGQQQQKANNSPNVRVIPIQVEGRDAPIVNTNIDTSTNFGSESFRDPSFEGRLPRDFGNYQRHSPRFGHKERVPTPPQYQYAPGYPQYVPPQQQQQFPPQYQQFVPPQQHFMPSQQQQYAPQHQQQPPPPPQHQQQHPQQQAFAHQQQHSQKAAAPQAPPQQQQQPPPPSQQQQQQQQQHPQGPSQKDETDSKPPPHPKPEPVKDPMEKVQLIQKEVEELMKQVESFKGNSRTDKQYLMLDELLTRQLLLLDNIDTEGKENVRQARKDAIRSIQKYISTLESKVPLVENNESSTEKKEVVQGVETKAEEAGAAAAGAPQAMEVDQTKENTPVESKQSQNMEVDSKDSKESQQSQEQNKENI